MAHLATVDDVLEKLGGTAVVARLTDKSMQSISNARTAGRLPPDTFLIMTASLIHLGHTASPELWRIRPSTADLGSAAKSVGRPE